MAQKHKREQQQTPRTGAVVRHAGIARPAPQQCGFPGSAPQGGDLLFFPRKYVVDEQFSRVAYSMKPGEISDVVESATGLHLIKVTERKQGTSTEYAKVKGEVREFYMEDLKQNLLNQLRKEAKIDIHLP